MYIALVNNPDSLRLILVKQIKEQIRIGQIKGIGGLLKLILMENIAVGVIPCPLNVVYILYALNVHGKALQAVGNLHGSRLDILAAHLLEIGELGDFHAVQPYLPAQAPGAESRRLPVILYEADIMLFRIDAKTLQRGQVQLLNVVRRRLHDDLELMMLVQAVRIVAVAAVSRAAGRLHICHIPRLRPQYTQKSKRIHGTGALFYIIRLAEDAALL